MTHTLFHIRQKFYRTGSLHHSPHGDRSLLGLSATGIGPKLRRVGICRMVGIGISLKQAGGQRIKVAKPALSLVLQALKVNQIGFYVSFAKPASYLFERRSTETRRDGFPSTGFEVWPLETREVCSHPLGFPELGGASFCPHRICWLFFNVTGIWDIPAPQPYGKCRRAQLIASGAPKHGPRSYDIDIHIYIYVQLPSGLALPTQRHR